MSEQDREDVLLIVEAVLDDYLSERLVKEAVEVIGQSIDENWHILKLIHERKEPTT